MISLRDGMGSGWDGKFFRRRRRRRRRRRGGQNWKSQNRVDFLGNRVKIVEIVAQIGEKSENRNLRWGIPDSADRSVLKS